MRRLTVSFLLVPILMLGCATSDLPTGATSSVTGASASTDAENAAPIYTVPLSGANEIGAGGARGAGDLDGIGTARVRVDVPHQTICYEIAVHNIVLPARAAHIHRGVAAVNGPVVVPLNAPDDHGQSGGCIVVAPELAQEIEAHPAGFYVNVHNVPFPGGAVRGQLQ